jgi:hypothetical protein
VVNTDLWQYIVGEEGSARMTELGGLGKLAMGAMRLIAKTPEEGSSTQVFLSATGNDDFVKGTFLRRDEGECEFAIVCQGRCES